MEHFKEQRYVFWLMGHALTGAELSVMDGLDWEYIYKLCKFHKVDNIAAFSVKKLPEHTVPEKVRQLFEMAEKKAMAREAVQHLELEKIQSAFEKEGIDNLPLKGSILKEYYPSPDMRFLTDLDILFKEEEKAKVEQVLLGLGYEKYADGDHHDIYTKEPYMTVEMHKQCYSDNDVLERELEDIWAKVEKKEGTNHCYVMGWNEYYIYMVAHMAKHFKYGGIGIRMLLDFVVFEQKLMDRCDRAKVETCLDKAGVFSFEKKMREEIGHYMDQGENVTFSKPLWDSIIENGANGLADNSSALWTLKDGEKKTNVLKNEIIMFRRIIFPGLKGMAMMYPVLKKVPFLLPFAWIYRIVIKALNQREKSMKVLKRITNRKKKKQMLEVCKETGMLQKEKKNVL